MAKQMKGKEWFKIFSPKMFDEKLLGETPAMEADNVIGRTIETSLTDLTSDPTRYYIKLFFKINQVNGSNAQTVFTGHECTRDFIARIVQLRTQRLDTNSVYKLEDNEIRIKTIAIANNHITSSVATTIRKKISEILEQELAGKTTDEFITLFTSGNLQQKIRMTIKKIYPVRHFELRKSEVIEKN
jgi:small subunit ribosomal protein S3Ae